jgi:hypothetical protein
LIPYPVNLELLQSTAWPDGVAWLGDWNDDCLLVRPGMEEIPGQYLQTGS